MTRYYGTISTEMGRATRQGKVQVSASAQSHGGSVGVTIHKAAGVEWVTIDVAAHSTENPKQPLIKMPLASIIEAANGYRELQPLSPHADAERIQGAAS